METESFLHPFVASNRPVAFRIPDLSWCRLWSLEAIAARFGEAVISVEQAGVVFVGERTLRRVRLDTLIRTMDRSVRWKGLDFLGHVPAMRADLARSPAPHERFLPADSWGQRRTLWIAPATTCSSLHHDGDYGNLNFQVAGRKRFLLIPPPSHRQVHSWGSAESPINPFAPDFDRFPRFAEIQTLGITLEPGEALFIPKYWWHCVDTLSPAVNVSTHFLSCKQPSAWRVLEGAPFHHRFLTAVAASLKRRGEAGIATWGRRAWWAAYARLVPRPQPQPR